MENHKKIAFLITKSRKETLTEQEQSQLNDWLSQSEQNQRLFKRLTDESHLRKLTEIDVKAERKEIMKLYEHKMHELGRGVHDRYRTYIWAAVSFLGVLGIAGLIFYFNKSKETPLATIIPESKTTQTSKPLPLDSYIPGKSEATLTFDNGLNVLLDTVPIGSPIATIGAIEVVKKDSGLIVLSRTSGSANINRITDERCRIKITTPLGGQYQLTLTDGSTISLNALSVLQFPASFNERERTVFLSGEAYFDVSNEISADDHTKKPFVVNVNKTQVYVLGTEFNIMAYQNEKVMKTTLVNGGVKISNGGVYKFITSGQQAQVDKKGNFLILDKKQTNINEAIAWKSKEIRMNQATLKEVLHQISRLYGVEISLDDKSEFNELMNFDISKDEPLSKALDLVQRLSKGTYKYENGIIYFAI